MVTLREAQEDYIKLWNQNAEQHFIHKDYDWVASLVEQTGAKTILEIGCGVGYSTLAFARKNIKTISIDSIPEAIIQTKKLLTADDVSVSLLDECEETLIKLKIADLIADYSEVSRYAQSTDLVLICNPGGKLENQLTKKEIKMLHWGNYSDEQMKEETVQALHKWAMLIGTARLAKENNKPLIIIDRGNIQELNDILETIAMISGLQGVGRSDRQIEPAPKDGIKLNEMPGEKLYLGAGLYSP